MKAGPIDFYSDVRHEVLKYLPYDRGNEDLENAVQGLDPSTLLIRLLNWRERLIHPHNRAVALSAEFSANPLYQANREPFDLLFKKIMGGDDISPHLSELIRFGYLPRDLARPLKHNPSLDLLLNEWGMHHLHISSVIGPRGFTERADEILIVIFREDVAFVVDIVNHGEWSDQRLVEIAYRNWPEQKLFVALNGVVGMERNISSDDRARLRKAGVTTVISVDGKVLIAAGGGLSTAGTSTRASMNAIAILKKLSHYERNPKILVSEFLNVASYAGIAWPETADFHFRLIATNKKYCEGIVEENTNKPLFFL